jgi:hypothetical protein
MSDKIEKPKFPEDKKEEPGLPVKIPLSIVRWAMYSCFMSAATLSFLMPPMDITVRQWVGISVILGHFASQLNALIKK